jgi:hypothetical protein
VTKFWNAVVASPLLSRIILLNGIESNEPISEFGFPSRVLGVIFNGKELLVVIR